jgi:GNAT superfamily N-acetyltransferase
VRDRWLADAPGPRVSGSVNAVEDLCRIPKNQDVDKAEKTTRDVQVVRDDDPRCAELEAAGYRVVGESWGARLRLSEPPELSVMRDAVVRAEAVGIALRELGPDFSDDLFSLEYQNNADYPLTPATTQKLRDADAIRGLWDKYRIFGALDGAQLVAATVIGQKADRGETQFTSVLSAYRGRGIGKAVKAASILALAEDGLRLFSTGGAGVNEASMGANRALGYTIEERWRSYERDIGSATPNSYGCSWV